MGCLHGLHIRQQGVRKCCLVYSNFIHPNQRNHSRSRSATAALPEFKRHKTKDHPSHVGEMSDVTARIAEARIQLQQSISDYEVLGLNGYGKKEKKNTFVGKQISQRQQDTKNGPRCSYGRNIEDEIHLVHGLVGKTLPAQHKLAACFVDRVHLLASKLLTQLHEMDLVDGKMQQRSANATDEIVAEKALGSQSIFDQRAEHPQGEHIRKEVDEVTVHEKVGHQLVGLEVHRFRVVETQVKVEPDAQDIGGGDIGQKHEPVDDQQVLNHLGHHAKAGALRESHTNCDLKTSAPSSAPI